MANLEKVRAICKEIGRRLVNNNFETTVKMKRDGKEFNITVLHGKKIAVYTDRGVNQYGETIWNKKVGIFPNTFAVAEFIAEY